MRINNILFTDMQLEMSIAEMLLFLFSKIKLLGTHHLLSL